MNRDCLFCEKFVLQKLEWRFKAFLLSVDQHDYEAAGHEILSIAENRPSASLMTSVGPAGMEKNCNRYYVGYCPSATFGTP